MQNAYASNQVAQLIGRFSWPPLSDGVQDAASEQARFAFVGAKFVVVFQLESHPVS
jgi:hypothetical protein